MASPLSIFKMLHTSLQFRPSKLATSGPRVEARCPETFVNTAPASISHVKRTGWELSENEKFSSADGASL